MMLKALQRLSELVKTAFPKYIFGPSVIVNTANSEIFKALLKTTRGLQSTIKDNVNENRKEWFELQSHKKCVYQKWF